MQEQSRHHAGNKRTQRHTDDGQPCAAVTACTEDEFAPAIDTIPDSVLSAHIEYRPDLTITSQCMPAISCAEFLHIPVVYIALQPMYPTKEFPPWTFHVGRFEDKNAWMHKPLGQLFLDVYDYQTFLRGVKRCRCREVAI